MPRVLAVLLLACLSLALPAHADSQAQTKQQIEQAQRDIAELQKLLKTIESEKSGVLQQLKKTEGDMGQLQQQIKGLEEQLKQGEQEVQRLEGEKKKLNEAKTRQEQLLGRQARAAFQSGRQEYLKLLLNQEHPERFSRTLTYYDYLNKARLEQLDTFNETLRQLGNIELQISQQQSQLLEQKSALDGRREALAQVRQEHQAALAKLNKQYASQDSRLQARQQDQAKLNQVLKTIEETLARQAREREQAERAAALAAQQAAQRAQQIHASSAKPAAAGPLVSSGSGVTGAFAKARGRLPWPVNGRILANFSSPRGDDPRAKWDGVLIGASAGSSVKAIHDGRVVFADWLRGAGLLVIIDHGNGYLSLYGHNQSLLKTAGSSVKAGEAIATVGNSGGQGSPALYFAIREQGRASDPARWCRTQG